MVDVGRFSKDEKFEGYSLPCNCKKILEEGKVIFNALLGMGSPKFLMLGPCLELLEVIQEVLYHGADGAHVV